MRRTDLCWTVLPFRACQLISLAMLTAVERRANASVDSCFPKDDLSPCINSDALWLQPDGGVLATLPDPAKRDRGSLVFRFALSYQLNPIGLRIASPDPSGTTLHVVHHALSAVPMWDYSVTQRLHLSLAAPFSVYQNGAGLSDLRGTNDELSRSSIRDARVGVSMHEWAHQGASGHHDATARIEFSFPTGQSGGFASDQTVVAAPSLIYGYAGPRFEFRAQGGARLRREVEFANVSVGSQLALGMGASYRILKKPSLSIAGELNALLPLIERRDALPPAPAEGLLSVSSVLTRGLSGGLGAGSGFSLAHTQALFAPDVRSLLWLTYSAAPGTSRMTTLQ